MTDCRWRHGAFVLVLLLACDDKSGETKSGDAKSGDAKSADAKSEPKVDARADRPDDLCKAFDKDAVASAFGWSGLGKVSGVGGSAAGIRHRTCGYVGKDAVTDQHFGVTFSNAKEFDERHFGFDVKYEPRAAVANYETRVAKNQRVVVFQIKTPELLVTVDATERGKTGAELEPKLEAAAVALLGSLPPDATAILLK